jgi:hypothetical protein
VDFNPDMGGMCRLGGASGSIVVLMCLLLLVCLLLLSASIPPYSPSRRLEPCSKPAAVAAELLNLVQPCVQLYD